MLKATVGFDIHRGAVASADRRPLPALDVLLPTVRRIAVLEGLNDPENLGAIARSARAFGIDALVLDPTCIDPYYRRTVRVSMGEILFLPVARASDWKAGLETIRAAGFEMWALTPRPDATDLWTLPVPDRLALLLGAEGPGLSRAATRRRIDRGQDPDRARRRLAQRGCRGRRGVRRDRARTACRFRNVLLDREHETWIPRRRCGHLAPSRGMR